MSIAHKLNWATASKPKFGKSTEHSGAKKGKGAWDKKKTAKKTSNKGRRAADKKASQDTTVGDESDGPFPGAAPLFTKAASLNWTTAEPRPCYPSEEPVEDHCNDGIAPPAPGGGDDMGEAPPNRDPDTQDWLDEQSYEDDVWTEDDEVDHYHEDMMNPDRDRDEESSFFPMDGPQMEDPRGIADPHGARDPNLPPDAPHQFWAQETNHVQDALNKYLMPQLDNPNPEISEKARRILMEGPHAE